MNWTKRLTLLSGVALALSAAAEPRNPVVRLFPANVVYRQGFDDGTLLPDVGRVAKVQDAKTVEFAEGGLFGKCLSAGSVYFGSDTDDVPFLETRAAGTLVCWVRYVEDPPEGEKTGFTFFLADLNAPEGQRGRLLMLKLHDCAMAGLYEYFVGGKRYAKTATTGISYNRSWSSPWPKGEWRMFALVWSGGRLSISQNGADLSTCALDHPLFPVKGSCELRAPARKGKDRFYQLDELAVLDRALTKDELRRLYDETRKESAPSR